MYWWGGFGVSTEHTAYRNLRAGIPAPLSGAIATNGTTVAEQIGGQIFIDTWGWVNPGNPQRAADMSAMAASVAHDGDGLNGARFCAAAIAQAFVAKSMDEILDDGPRDHPRQLDLRRASPTPSAPSTRRNPDDWRACRDMLTAEWGYDRYPGVCHIIPNAGITVMALCYGAGDLPRTVEIATMGGWDTDCNAGNAGAIVGTFQGLQPGWDKYRKPINDFVIASGVLGTVNVVDIPSFARELTSLALRLRGDETEPTAGLGAPRRPLRFRRAGRHPRLPHRAVQHDLAQGIVRAAGPELARLARSPARPARARAGRPRLLEALLPPLRLRRRALPPDVHARSPTPGRR